MLKPIDSKGCWDPGKSIHSTKMRSNHGIGYRNDMLGSSDSLSTATAGGPKLCKPRPGHDAEVAGAGQLPLRMCPRACRESPTRIEQV